MTHSVPNQEYLETLAQSIREAKEIEFEKLCELLFAIIEYFCSQLPAQRGRADESAIQTAPS